MKLVACLILVRGSKWASFSKITKDFPFRKKKKKNLFKKCSLLSCHFVPESEGKNTSSFHTSPTNNASFSLHHWVDFGGRCVFTYLFQMSEAASNAATCRIDNAIHFCPAGSGKEKGLWQLVWHSSGSTFSAALTPALWRFHHTCFQPRFFKTLKRTLPRDSCLPSGLLGYWDLTDVIGASLSPGSKLICKIISKTTRCRQAK